jgi:hypothetical protein
MGQDAIKRRGTLAVLLLSVMALLAANMPAMAGPSGADDAPYPGEGLSEADLRRLVGANEADPLENVLEEAAKLTPDEHVYQDESDSTGPVPTGPSLEDPTGSLSDMLQGCTTTLNAFARHERPFLASFTNQEARSSYFVNEGCRHLVAQQRSWVFINDWGIDHVSNLWRATDDSGWTDPKDFYASRARAIQTVPLHQLPHDYHAIGGRIFFGYGGQVNWKNGVIWRECRTAEMYYGLTTPDIGPKLPC